MEWKTLKQLISGIVGVKGDCLIYVRERFGIASKYLTALAAWQAVPAQYRHTDQNFPSVPVAVFFTGGDGHVEIWIPGVGFDGSPYNTATGHIELPTIPEVEQHYGVKFAGWTEWLDGVLVAEQVVAPAPSSKMPAVGSSIELVGVQARTTYHAGTTNVAGTIHTNNNVYIVRGTDSKYPGRILINSASAGGDGVALALYYTNGTNIGGWKQL